MPAHSKPNSPVIQTARLRLRPLNEADRDVFAGLNADPVVMEFFSECWSREKSDAALDRMCRHWREHGFGYWAVELAEIPFAGVCGLLNVPFEASFTPAIEVGYRLTPRCWNQGLATEAAAASLRYGFEQLDLSEIVAYAVTSNVRSRRVMEKLGMHYAQDFDHPRIEEGHPRRRHALYRINASAG